ncbi:MAG: methionyl-tRNA formyltransferase [Anaerolineaceae bacterium]|nr:methionyl-tRNA formyltransferase [Anaerolineaceae bacterium]
MIALGNSHDGAETSCVKITSMNTRVVFMGSPIFAVPALQKLTERFFVAGVVTQPDRPAGRGRVLMPPPIKTLAEQLGIPIYQPESLRSAEALLQLTDWHPDIIIVAAFGQILQQAVLELPQMGCLNIHGSLLPRWRGASPVQAALLAGDEESGVTIMKMDAGVDTGAILAARSESIRPNDTAETLGERLAESGAALLIETLPEYLNGRLAARQQEKARATYCSLIKKKDGLLDFSQPADALARRVRAFNPWPSAWLLWNGQHIKIHFAHVVQDTGIALVLPGTRGIIAGTPAIATPSGWLVLDEVQPAGKKKMSGNVFLRGARGWEGNNALLA